MAHRGRGKQRSPDPFMDGTLMKPVIAAINGYAMGGGFALVEGTDLRVAVRGAIFEVSEAKRWLLRGYQHGFFAGLPHPIATEMALGFRFTAERLYEVGFLNRLVDPDQLLPTAIEMAQHMLTLPPASRVNTVYMMRQMRARIAPNLQRLATKLHEHGDKEDLMESRRAFAEKRKPNFKGWKDAADRHRLPTLLMSRRRTPSNAPARQLERGGYTADWGSSAASSAQPVVCSDRCEARIHGGNHEHRYEYESLQPIAGRRDGGSES